MAYALSASPSQMGFNLILLQMLSSDPRIFLAQANANDGKLELHPPLSPLPPPPYSRNARRLCRAGALERAIHALLPPFSSLFSTLDAHCKVATHYLLLPPPSSLLWTPTAKCPRTSPSLLLPTLYSPLNYVNSVHKCAGCVPFLFFGIIRGVRPVHCAGK